MPYGARIESLPIVPPRRSRLAIRVIARDGRATVLRRTLLPVIGVDDVILPAFDDTLGAFAIRAQQGDTDARDALFFAFLPKLERLMTHARVPNMPAGMTGTWDRDDVEQEAYLVFTELVESWCGDVSFTSWLLARFPWRLRNTISAGVARPTTPPRTRPVPLGVAEEEPIVLEDLGPELREMVAVLVDSLPAHLGQALVAHAIHGRTKTEIAREMGVSRRTMVRYWQEIRHLAQETLPRPEDRRA